MTLRGSLPEGLYVRFRASGTERLTRVDGAWTALTRGEATSAVEDQMFRDLHTLKGDARVVGAAEVALLCQKLEDLASVSARRRFRVSEEVDAIVTMAIQFAGMLLRRKPGAARAGIDLDGFLARIDQVIADTAPRLSQAPALSDRPPSSASLAQDDLMVAPSVRAKLASVATTVYLEHLRASGKSRARLRGAWEVLAGEMMRLGATPLTPVLEGHAEAGRELARDLGRQVDVTVTCEDVRVDHEALDVLGTAVLHAVRNAVDHGIEPPALRRRSRKSEVGSIRIAASQGSAGVELVVADDGGGVDLDAVRRRAVERGLLGPGDPAEAAAVIEFLFLPGFSTRDSVSDVSGRGVGLDALRDGVQARGGSVTIVTERGSGTSLTVRLPHARVSLDVLAFRVRGSKMTFAVEATWSGEIRDASAEAAIDVLGALELPTEGAGPETGRVLEVRRGSSVVRLRGADDLRLAAAVRSCPMPMGAPVELVEVEGQDAILLVPDCLARAI